MSVIIFNKDTGKYLKKHSGSYNELVRSQLYRNAIYTKELVDTLGEGCLANWHERRNRENEIAKIRDKYLYNATPEAARVYHSAASAKRSVGHIMPDHLEIHEIKESFVCVIRPDGSSNCD